MASNNDSEEKESLSEIFQEGLDLYNHLGKIDEPTNSVAVQVLNNILIKFYINIQWFH